MRHKKNTGMTIVELLIYMALLSLMLITLTEIFVGAFSNKLESEAVNRIEEDGKYILARFMYDVEKSSSITTPSSPGSTNSSLILVIEGVSNTYSLSSGNLNLTNNLGTNPLNSSETTITTLTFKRLGNSGGKNSVKLSFTVQGKILRNNRYDSQSFSTIVGLR